MHLASLLIVAVLGCDGVSEQTEQSKPIPPTVELGDPAGMGVKWATLEGLVTSEAPAVPDALGGLALGQPEAEVQRALATMHDERMARPQIVELDGYRIYGAVLESYDGLGVSAIVDIERAVLHELDLGLPADQALYAFTEAWGPPDMQTDPKLGPVAVWANPETGVRVELTQLAEGRGVAKFRRVDVSAPAPAPAP